MYHINFHHHFDGMSSWKKGEEIEKLIEKAIRKYNRSSIIKTKVQALLEEAYGYWLRNREYHSDICHFSEYLNHWTVANRGCMPDEYLDEIEKQYGILQGDLHILPGKSSWNISRDWRVDNSDRKDTGAEK